MFKTLLTLAFCWGGIASLQADTTVAGLIFRAPSHWETTIPTAPTRAAQWRIPHERSKEPGEAVILYFGNGLGGDTASTIQRWQRAMTTAEGARVDGVVTEKKLGNNLKTTEIVSYGTYTGGLSVAGAPPTLKPGFGLAGVVIEGPQGNIFIRLTGPEALVKANLAGLRQMIATAQVVK